MKKIFLIIALFFICFTNIYAANAKYIFFIVAEGMSVSNEIALSNFLYGKKNMLMWSSFPIQAYMTTWSISSYNGVYSKDNFDSNKGYNIEIAGTKPYPYFFTEDSETYFKNSNFTDSAASATAMSTGQKVYNNSVCYDKQNDKIIPNIVDKINKDKIYNTALITTDNFYSGSSACFFAHNKTIFDHKRIAEEILSETKPEIVAGTYEIFDIHKVAESNGYYILENSEINKTQVGNLVNKPIFVKVKKYSTLEPNENFISESFEYGYGATKISDMVLYATKILLKKRRPFFMFINFSDIAKANCENDYNGMLGAVQNVNETITEIHELVNSEETEMNFDNTLIILVSPYSAGMLRFNNYLSKGRLPKSKMYDENMLLKTDTDISYKAKNNTNELVSCYCIGAKENVFNRYINENGIIDNTDIYNVLDDIFSRR